MKKKEKRTKDQVIVELGELIRTEGYIYSLCLILFEDFHHNLDKIHLVDYRSKLSVKECSLILGFLVQNKLDFSIPKSPEVVLDRKDRTYELMHELHFSFNFPQIAKLGDIMERQAKGEEMTDYREDRLNFFAKDGGMVEPMFYAGDGVYDFQYLEYLERKYKYDKDWLLENRNFVIEEITQIVRETKQVLQEKSKKVNLIDLKNGFSVIAQKARKKLKRQHSEDEIQKIERQNFIAATFYQYKELFPPITKKKEADDSDWRIFYENLIDLFIIRKSDFDDNINTQSFFDNFSFTPNTNKNYKGPGYFNILNSCPLIKLDEERYFAPIGYLIPEAVYESPFYWMCEDMNYLNKLSKHRGDAGEEIAYEFLCKVFGVENTFKSVLVTTNKGQPNTDIDVLCILGNKALCVQVKSKKLTLSAKRGDFEQLSKDFKGAIQDAYDQGLVSRACIVDNKAKFQDKNGNEIHLSNEIDEVYIMGLTTENYPSLVHQVHMMLMKEDKDPYPLFLSVFDLELLVHYLPDPFDFLYYVRQRIDLIDYFKADEELVYLGYHLDRKLWRIDGYDSAVLEPDFGANIDRNYYPYKAGLSHLLSEKNDPIHNRWKDPEFEKLSKVLKSSNHNKITDIIFHLLDWSGESRKNIVEQMIRIKNKSRIEGATQSIATATAPEFGVSYIVLESTNFDKLDNDVNIYSVVRKYKSKCDAWLGLGSFANSPNLVDFMVYLDELWEFDAELDAASTEFFRNSKGRKVILLKGNKKIGRNDPCPCQSGLKHKRCCGMTN